MDEPQGVGDLVEELWAATVRLYQAVLGIREPKNIDNVLELQVFSACTIAYGIHIAGGPAEDEAKVLQSFFLVDVAHRLAITGANIRDSLEARYEEYAPALAELFAGEGQNNRLIDVLPVHMMDRSAGMEHDAKHLRDLVLTHIEMMKPIFAGARAH